MQAKLEGVSLICSVFDELCTATRAKPLKEIPNENGRYLLFRGLRVQGNEETQEYSLFFVFNASDARAGLKEVDGIKREILQLPTLENVLLPNKVKLEEIKNSIVGLAHSYEFAIKIRLKGAWA
ncbi:hypothetical protein [Helicobacter enhydrae]|uniref:hypothetical protein n=1 Tax=Helicobacter enhydrae TaxID=222136 RepID=UPI0019020CCD|nr:hypothetical protein [Helicobacter enhydrae]